MQTTNQLPASMKAIIFDEFNNDPQIQLVQLPKPKNGEVLIKVFAAPIHPKDIELITTNKFRKRKYFKVMGVEGSGIVVQNGGGFIGWNLVGKHVSFIVKHQLYGSWAEYVIADANKCFVQDKNLEFEISANGIRNPLTVILMLEMTQTDGHKAIIQTGSCSSIGKMINKYFSENDVKVINVVRDQQQEEIMILEEKAKYVLNAQSAQFGIQLKKLCKQLNATALWDVVSGELVGRIIQEMPRNSTAYMYGDVSLKEAQINPRDLIYKNIKIEGFFSRQYLRSKNLLWKIFKQYDLKNLLKSSLSTKILKEFALEQFEEAIEFQKINKNFGKVLLKPQLSSKIQKKYNNVIDYNYSNKEQLQRILNVNVQVNMTASNRLQTTSKQFINQAKL